MKRAGGAKIERWKGRGRASGFSLVEVLAALTIFSIAVIAFLQGMAESVSIQAGLISIQRASMLAENILEEIEYTRTIEAGRQSGEFEGADAAYQWETNITETDIDALMEVVVTIAWNDGRGIRDYRLATLMTVPPEGPLRS